MTDFRALCAELLRAMDEIEECEAVDWGLVKTKPLKMANQSMTEARAALAEPEIPSESPTDEELRQLRRERGWPVVDSVLFAIARAVLARWGK